MPLTIRRRALGALALPALLPGLARAQAWPTGTVRFIVPFAAGGPVEVPARFIAEHIQGPLGQPVIVETRPGAGGSIGVRHVVQANDPHTLLFTTGSVAIAPALMRNPGYDPLADLVPITTATDAPLLGQAIDYGREVTRYSPTAIDAIRACVAAAGPAVTDAGLAVEDAQVRANFDSPDAREGVAAFLEKRPARFGRG